ISHHQRQVSGDGGINRKIEQSAQGDKWSKEPLQCERKTQGQHAIKNKHCNPCTSLYGTKIVLEINFTLSIITVVRFVRKTAQLVFVESSGGDYDPNPEFDQRRMFGVDAEVSVTKVRDARSDVIRLVECEAVETGCHRGPENRSSG